MRIKMKRINKKQNVYTLVKIQYKNQEKKITDRVTLWLYVSNAEASEKGLGKILKIRE